MARARKGAETVWEEQWRERIKAWRESGQTQLQFCRAHGLAVSSFSHWKGKLAQRDELRSLSLLAAKAAATDVDAASKTMPWTEVRWEAQGAEPVGAAQDGTGFEIVLPQGWMVRLGSRFEAEPLRRLLAVLGERSC
jgi:hypothetical protein